MNGWKHGGCSRREIPWRDGSPVRPEHKAIVRHVCRLEGQLTAFIVERDGGTTIYTSALISSACRHEYRALRLQAWLEQEPEQVTTRRSASKDAVSVATSETAGLSVMERAQLLGMIGQATDARDKCLRALGLDAVAKKDVWASIYSNPPALPRPATQPPVADVLPAPATDASERPVGAGGDA